MIKLDENLLTELGLGSLPKPEKTAFLKHMYETLEMRVGTRLAERMSDQQMMEFEQFIKSNDEQGAFHWLETNFPNYKEVVAEEFEKLKGEIQPLVPQILSASQAQAAQAAQMQTQPQPPGMVPPTAQPSFNGSQQPVQPSNSFAGSASVPTAQPSFQQPAYDQPVAPAPAYQPPATHSQPVNPDYGFAQTQQPVAVPPQFSAAPPSPAANNFDSSAQSYSQQPYVGGPPSPAQPSQPAAMPPNPTSSQPAYGPPPSFGQPSASQQPPAFGQPMTPPSPFGQGQPAQDQSQGSSLPTNPSQPNQ